MHRPRAAESAAGIPLVRPQASPLRGLVNLPEIPGVITADEISKSASYLTELQLQSGLIPWFDNGHTDPWNHVESCMALTVAGRYDEARRGYEWLRDNQRSDGSWYNYYTVAGAPDRVENQGNMQAGEDRAQHGSEVNQTDDFRVEDFKVDTNCVAYIATGVWHYYRATDDDKFIEAMWPTVTAAINYVISMQTDAGPIIWARRENGTPFEYALLTGSSSIYHSIGSALELATTLDEARRSWELAKAKLSKAILTTPEAFETKDRWAMDWYYPVLAGVVSPYGDPTTARRRLETSRERFVIDGEGVRCVDDEPWVTTAETAEAAIAYAVAGELEIAHELLRWTRALRNPDGSYYTGVVLPDRIHFPADERSSYSAAAVILAADKLTGGSATSDIF